jgi:hypothetical protein
VPAAVLAILLLTPLAVSSVSAAVRPANPPINPCEPAVVRGISPLCGGGGPGGAKNPCGSPTYLYASAYDNDNYSIYGINTTQAIYSQTVCGTDGVANFVTVYFPQTCVAPNGAWTYAELSIGYFEGPAGGTTNKMYRSPEYYYDEFTPSGSGHFSSCKYVFSVLAPAPVGSSASFQMQAAGTASNKWSLSIAGVVSVTGVTAAQSHGWTAGANLESHSAADVATAYFSSLADFAAPVDSCPGSWFPWSSSYTQRLPNDGTNPYQIMQNSANSFSMWTGSR